MESLRSSRVESFASAPVVVLPTSPISEVISALEQKDAYEAFIQEKNRVSTITLREILKASDISNMRVSSLMSPVTKLSPDDTVGKAARLMGEYRLRALPIVRKKAVEGVATAKSLCQALTTAKELGGVRINKIMKRNPITINGGEPVSKARNLMLRNGIDHLPVLDLGRLCGILLSSHIAGLMMPREGPRRGAFLSEPSGYLDLKVSALMEPNVLICDPEEKVLAVLKRMMEQGKTYALVQLWQETQGIVTYRDFMVLLAETETPSVPAYIVGLPEDPFEAELAKAKFLKGAKALQKSFPKIEEIRSTIKTKYISEDRRRYEVDVLITSRGKVYAYKETGWDLPSIFDQIMDKVKRIISRKPSKKRTRPRTVPPQ